MNKLIWVIICRNNILNVLKLLIKEELPENLRLIAFVTELKHYPKSKLYIQMKTVLSLIM